MIVTFDKDVVDETDIERFSNIINCEQLRNYCALKALEYASDLVWTLLCKVDDKKI